jgi:diguanylate cyclase
LKVQSESIAQLHESLHIASVNADTDVLTGLTNRRAFERQLGAACERARSSGTDLSLAICDIDYFKRVNDTYGHQIGDRVLRYVSNVLTQNLSEFGYVSRFGGEEFVVIFEGMPSEEVVKIVDDTREDLAGRNIKNRETEESLGRVSFSAGISIFSPKMSESKLLELADVALYDAKNAGRNKVIMSTGQVN